MHATIVQACMSQVYSNKENGRVTVTAAAAYYHITRPHPSFVIGLLAQSHAIVYTCRVTIYGFTNLLNIRVVIHAAGGVTIMRGRQRWQIFFRLDLDKQTKHFGPAHGTEGSSAVVSNQHQFTRSLPAS
jgi:hypothetical protein